MKNKKTLIISIVTIVALICITVGISLAFFNYAQAGTTDNTIETGSITFLYTETSGIGRGIAITDAFPMSNTEGKALIGEGNVFDFNINSTNSFNKKIDFEVTARKKGTSTLSEDVVIMYLTKVNGASEEEILLDNFSNLTQTSKTNNYVEKTLYNGEVNGNSNYDQDYRLRMWVDEDTDYTNGEYNDKTFTVTVNVYANASVVETPETKLYTIVNDADSNGTADIGDEIALGDEHFYVISNDGININALSKYNLNVGDYALAGTTGIQNSTAIGYVRGASKIIGTTAFSSDSQKGTNYSDYSGSIVEGYVNNYVTYLNTQTIGLNATGRLILKEELETLGCTSRKHSCLNAPSWVYSTSYWSGSAYDTNSVWLMYSDDCFDNDYYNEDGYFGVRPVITIES